VLFFKVVSLKQGQHTRKDLKDDGVWLGFKKEEHIEK